MKFVLADQAAEANREIGMRHRVYPARVKAGKMTQAEADQGLALMRAIRDTLRLFARFEGEVRATVFECLRRERLTQEADEVRDDPAVRAVLEGWPGAEITNVQPIEGVGDDDTNADARGTV